MRKTRESEKLLQSGVIPYRIIKGKPYIYLITSVKKRRWIVPKGVLEDDLTPIESAIMEAYEEAGIIGIVENEVFSTYFSRKWGRDTVVSLYPMKVLEAVTGWPEKGIRKRILIPLTKKELKARIYNPGLRKLLIKFAVFMEDKTGSRLTMVK